MTTLLLNDEVLLDSICATIDDLENFLKKQDIKYVHAYNNNKIIMQVSPEHISVVKNAIMQRNLEHYFSVCESVLVEGR
jgi:hypothetical protein